MSTTGKALEKLRKEIGRGGYKDIAEKVGCTSDWVGQVLRSPVLAEKHEHIVDAALLVLEEKNLNRQALKSKILGAVK